MKQILPFEASTLVEASLRASANLGPLSTSIAILEILYRIDVDHLPRQVEEQIGAVVPFFIEICALFEDSQTHVAQHTDRVTSEIRAQIAPHHVVVCSSYESILWDPVFESTPDKVFFVVVMSPSAIPSRLRHFPSNVKTITFSEVPLCAGTHAALVTSSYGHVPGVPQDVYVPFHTQHLMAANLHSAFQHHWHVAYLDCAVNKVPEGMTSHTVFGRDPMELRPHARGVTSPLPSVVSPPLASQSREAGPYVPRSSASFGSNRHPQETQ